LRRGIAIGVNTQGQEREGEREDQNDDERYRLETFPPLAHLQRFPISWSLSPVKSASASSNPLSRRSLSQEPKVSAALAASRRTASTRSRCSSARCINRS